MQTSDKNKSGILETIVVISIIVMAYLFYDRKKIKDKNKKLAKEKQRLEDDKLRLIQDSINNNDNLSNEVKCQLNGLIIKFETIDQRVANEIAQALQLYQLGQIENAIEDLSKIIENLLKHHYAKDTRFNKWIIKRKNCFHNLIEFCYTIDKKISKIEYESILTIKAIRNAEAHELDLKLRPLQNASGITSAIDSIIKISSFVYPVS